MDHPLQSQLDAVTKQLAEVTEEREACFGENKRLISANHKIERKLADTRARLKVVEERERKLRVRSDRARAVSGGGRVCLPEDSGTYDY